MNWPTVLALLTMFVAVPLNWYTTLRLWSFYRDLDGPGRAVSRERAVAATAVAVLITVFGLIFLNNDLVPPLVAFDTSKYLTRGVMLLAGLIPALYWLRLYRKGR